MNALFGLWQIDGSPLESHSLTQMASALSFWGSNPPGLWWDEFLGLGTVPDFGGDIANADPIYDPASGVTVVASARLINRKELAESLGLPLPSLDGYTDGHLILAAWQRWETECVHHLDGDWHFALWESRPRRLFLARDQHGTSSFYYHHSAGLFAFASTQKPLLALDAIPRQPNLLRMAQILAGRLGDGSETGYAGISRLPPAHWLLADHAGVEVRRYWFPEHLPEICLDDDACVEAFLHYYRRAVESRLAATGTTGLMLSGGLDSGSLAVLAGDALAARGETLHAFTSVPTSQAAVDLLGGGPVDEGPLAAGIAAAVGAVHLTRIDAADVSPLAGVERMLWVHDEPAYPAGNSYWLAAIYAAAQAQGVTTLFTGTAGNDTVSWRGVPPDLSYLLWAGRPGPLVAGIQALGERSGLSTRQVLWTALAKPLLRRVRARVRARLPFWAGRGQIDWGALNPLHSSFLQREEIASALSAENDVQPPALSTDPGWAAWRLDGPGRWLPPTFHFQDGGASGMDVLDPTADRRLMEFCFALPTAHYHNGSQDRWLIRRAMSGRMPDSARLIRRRARQSADLVNRLHLHRDEMEAALGRLVRHPLAAEVVDMARLTSAMAQIGESPATVSHLVASVLLLRGVMVGLFLERF